MPNLTILITDRVSVTELNRPRWLRALRTQRKDRTNEPKLIFIYSIDVLNLHICTLPILQGQLKYSHLFLRINLEENERTY